MELDLPFVWAGLIAFAVLAYVVLDGFDLGVGILFPLLETEQQRDLAMNTVAPVWDGNETWLVLGGGGLFAVFPLAYATILPALYAPITAMLIGLVFRGVAFEFRARAITSRYIWSAGFFGGSLVAALAQGITLGAIIQGIEIADRTYVGGWWDWLTPFSLLSGVALVIGYALLGATWVVMKTEGRLAERAVIFAWIAGGLTFFMIGLVCLITPFLNPLYLERWFTMPTAVYSFVLPGLLVVCGWTFYASLIAGHDTLPFLSALGVFVLCFAGLGVSFYPYIVPSTITVHEAAAPEESLRFLLVGAAILIPIILAYTTYAYWVFRGKVHTGEGYH